jgi:hypothetical protein
MNPMFFSQPVTFADIKEYTASSRLPVVHGDVLNLQNLSEFTSLTALQDARRSCRSFAPTPIGLDQVGHVLTRSYSLSRHTTPSAGGLYPVKVYFVVTSDQRDLPAGYYEYDPEKETCVRYGVDVDLELLQFAFDSDTLLFGAPVIVVIAADMERHGGKYSNRGTATRSWRQAMSPRTYSCPQPKSDFPCWNTADFSTGCWLLSSAWITLG